MGRGWFILGNAYKKIRIYEKAKEVYLEGLDHALENNDELRQVKLYHRLGLLYSALEDYEEARSYYQTIINYEGDTSRGYLRYVGKALHDMGSSYMYEGNYKEAVPYLRKALAIKNSDTEKFITYMDLGTSYVELGEHEEGIVYYQKAKECYIAVESIKEHIELFRLMDLAYRKVDDHKNSSASADLFYVAIDEFAATKEALNNQYSAANLKSWIDKHQSENYFVAQLKKYKYIIGFLVGFILLLIFMLFVIRRQKSKLKNLGSTILEEIGGIIKKAS